MTLSIKNNGYVFLLRLDLMFSISLFRTILSFCSVFTRDFSCAMSWKYEQCWQLQQPIITEKLTGPKKKNLRKSDVQTTLHWLLSCAMLSGVSWTTLHKVFSCTVLSQEY